MPVKVLELELSQALRPIWGLEGYDRVRALVRYDGRPVRWIEMPVRRRPAIMPDEIRETINDELGREVVAAVLMTPAAAARKTPTPPITVAICTRDRPDQLARTLVAVRDLEYPAFEVLVVDNASRTEATAVLTAQHSVRYVHEPRPGLDWARNRGIQDARHEIVAFIDDDAVPDRGWLRAIAASFENPDVMAVTGPVAPAELETDAQVLFELEYGGMVQALERRVYRKAGLSPRGLLWASAFGVGTNMAFRRQVFDRIGKFDVALDVGTPSGGCGDVEMFHRLVARGYTLVYEPSVLVWHRHRRDFDMLRRQLRDNGCGFGAYLLTCARQRTVEPWTVARFAVREWLGWWLLRRLVRPGRLPWRLAAVEFAGALRSVSAYRAARVQARRLATAHPPQVPQAPRALKILLPLGHEEPGIGARTRNS